MAHSAGGKAAGRTNHAGSAAMSVRPAPSETGPKTAGDAPSARRRGWRGPGLVAGAVVLGLVTAWAGSVGLRAWRLRAELYRAKEEIDKGWFPLASQRL